MVMYNIQYRFKSLPSQRVEALRRNIVNFSVYLWGAEQDKIHETGFNAFQLAIGRKNTVIQLNYF